MGKPARVGKIPKRLQAVLSSVNVKTLDLRRNRDYVIQQVLLYGSLKEIKWLFKTYGQKQIVDSFVNHPIRMYPKETFHFIKNFILRLRDKKVTEEKYVTSISGPIRLRATGSI